MTSSVDQNLTKLQQTVQLVFHRMQQVERENARLIDANKRQAMRISELEEAQEKWLQQSITLSSGIGRLPDEDKKQLKKRLDKYLSDIDKCLSTLHAK